MTIREILKKDNGRHTVRVAGRKAIIDRERGRGFTIQVEEGSGQYSVSTYNEQGELEKTVYITAEDGQSSEESLPNLTYDSILKLPEGAHVVRVNAEKCSLIAAPPFKRADNHKELDLVCYRLCGCASGALITDIWNCSTSIRHSLLHFGQKRGKFFRIVSSLTLSRVLFPQIGQRINSVLSIPSIFIPVFILFLFFLPIFTDELIPNRNANTNQKHYCQNRKIHTIHLTFLYFS